MSIRIRDVQENDLETVVAVFQSAFQSTHNRLEDFRRVHRLQPHTWFLAIEHGVAVGMTAAWHFADFSYVGMMGVHRDAQRRGIGRVLLHRLLADMDVQGFQMALLDATEMGEGLYRSMGFQEEDVSVLWCLEAPIEKGSHSASALGENDLDAIEAFDTPIYGTNRRNLLDIWFRDFGQRSFVTRDEMGMISGYTIVQPTRIGPWVARDVGAARQLLIAALTLDFEGQPEVIIPGKNRVAQELVRQFGFIQKRVTKHMRRGGSGLTGQREFLYGQTSFALG